MAETKIEWADYTFNPWRGCTKVSEGCRNCYAEKLSKRNPSVLGEWGPGGRRVLGVESYLDLPYKWNRAASARPYRCEKCGTRGGGGSCGCGGGDRVPYRPRVFALSLGDWLDPEVPPEYLFGLLEDAICCAALDWLLLTKRPELWRERLESAAWSREIREWLDGKPPANVWIGASVEDQPTADARIPELLRIPAAVHFVSYEPALGPVDFSQWLPPSICRCGHAETAHYFNPLDTPYARTVGCQAGDGSEANPICGCRKLRGETSHEIGDPYINHGLNWVIVGGESGPHARPAHPDWFRSARDQCQAAGVPFHFKQHGEFISADQLPLGTWSLDKARWVEPNGSHVWVDDPSALGATRTVTDDAALVVRVGKKAAGRLLDGREWNEFPEARS